jgi:hypothetical protein
VVVTGGGVHKAATTGASGVVRLTVLPKWRGFLQVGIPNLTVCSRRIAIDPAHAGKQLTG